MTNLLKREEGISLFFMLMAVVTILAVISGIVSTQTNFNFDTIGKTNRTKGAQFIQTGSDLHSALNAMEVGGFAIQRVRMVSSDLSSSSLAGLYDPTVGLLSEPHKDSSRYDPKPSGISSTDYMSWALVGDATLTAPVGTLVVPGVASTTPEWGIITTHVKAEICVKINEELYPEEGWDTVPVASLVSAASVIDGIEDTNKITDNTIDLTTMSPANAFDSRTQGCFLTNDSTPIAVFFRVVKPA